MDEPLVVFGLLGAAILAVILAVTFNNYQKTQLMAKSPDPIAFACADDSRHVACVIVAGRK